jgi:two-component system, response regulator PdtaR
MQGLAEIAVPQARLWLGGASGSDPEDTPGGSFHDKPLDKASYRIGVVEDEPFVRLDIEFALQSAGHHVVGTADSGDGAVALAERERPDIIIMDVRLHGPRDGIDAAIEIWQRFAIRCVFASANLDATQRARAAAANPWGFVDKPFRSAALVAALPAGL